MKRKDAPEVLVAFDEEVASEDTEAENVDELRLEESPDPV